MDDIQKSILAILTNKGMNIDIFCTRSKKKKNIRLDDW